MATNSKLNYPFTIAPPGPSQGTITVTGSVPTITGTTVNIPTPYSNGATSIPYSGGMSIPYSGGTGFIPQPVTYPYTITPTVPDPFAITTSHGVLRIDEEGRVHLPPGMPEEDAAQAFWDFFQNLAHQAFQAAVRKEAAKAVREHLPQLLPDLDEYQKAFLPNAIATAIETSKN